MNSHFQSSETTWTVTGVALELIGLRGSRSWAPTQATPPTRSTVMAGIDPTSSSRRPEYSKSGKYAAREFDARNQKATAKVARIVGMTIASMIPSELNRICRSAMAMVPFGSRTPSLQPPSAAAQTKAPISGPYRMSDLVCVQGERSVRGLDAVWLKLDLPKT